MNSTQGLLTGFAIFILLSVTITTAVAPDRLDSVLNRGTLITAIEPLGAPYGSIVPGAERNPDSNCSEDCYTENQLTGFDIAVSGKIARKLGVDACYIDPSHEQIANGNWSGWDIYPGYYITYDRLQDYYFTRPTVTDSSRFFIRADDTNITKPADLSGKPIGVGNNSVQLLYLNNELDLPGMVNENPVIDPVIREYIDDYDALDALRDGSVDAVLISDVSGVEAIANGSPFTGLDPVAFTGYAGLAIPKKSGEDAKSLALNIDEIIAGMHESGELSTISQTYFGTDITKDAGFFNMSTLNQFSG